jgi:hypothetical protein
MKTWIVITEIFLLGLWIDDWGLGVQGTMARLRRAIRKFETLTPTHLIATFMSQSNDSSLQQWYRSMSIRPPPLLE